MIFFSPIKKHLGKIEKGSLKINQSVNLEIDATRRKNARAYHSATHLLHEALRRTLGKHVTQKGSLVSPEKLRFDFSHNKPIEKDEMSKINKIVNDFIIGSSDVQTRIMTPKEAVGLGALALFGEKDGEELELSDPGEVKRRLSEMREHQLERIAWFLSLERNRASELRMNSLKQYKNFLIENLLWYPIL